ncbi:MAG TPA: DUF3857 and transglutaminase domain-containing protein [Gemmatimonadaceae bacterium]
MRRLVVSLLLAAAPALCAQAPHITSAGDPSVRADTIYRLAVDAARYPEQEAAYLLDDGVVRFEADGRSSKTFRQIVQILKPSAVERWQEHSFSYSPTHEALRINWIRVVRPNGEVVSAKPSHVQDADVPASEDDPVYSDRRIRRASLTGVAPGTLVDFSYTTEELKPFMPHEFSQSWGVSTGLQVARSRLVVDVPTTITPHIVEKNLDFSRTEAVAGGRRIYTWATANVPKIKPEPLAADSNGVYMSVAIVAPLGWADIARWYAGLAHSREETGPTVAARVDSVVHGAKTRADSIRAVHKWIAQDIRYVAIALGLGGYQPRTPERVVATGFGDCKDKATLFVAALRHLGIEAYPVLLSSAGRADRTLPAVGQFNHEIAAVGAPAHYTFVDLTAGVVPYGELPFSEQGGFALVVHPDGSSEEVTLPKVEPSGNRSVIRVSGSLDSTGTFNGTYEETAAGAPQYSLRSLFYNPLDSAQRRNIGNAIARKLFEGADGDSLVGFDGRDLSATLRLGMLIRHAKAATPTGNTMILNSPFGNFGSLATVAKELERLEKRRFPIDPAGFWGAHATVTELSIALPPGWHAQLPKSVRAQSAFGSYESTYTEANGTLRLARQMTGATKVQPPESIGDFVAFLRAVAADDAKFIVLTHGDATSGH